MTTTIIPDANGGATECKAQKTTSGISSKGKVDLTDILLTGEKQKDTTFFISRFVLFLLYSTMDAA